MGVLKSQFLTTRWPKTFFLCPESFFLGQQPPWGQRICINYCRSLVSFIGALPNYVCVLKHSRAGGRVGHLVQVGVKQQRTSEKSLFLIFSSKTQKKISKFSVFFSKMNFFNFCQKKIWSSATRIFSILFLNKPLFCGTLMICRNRHGTQIFWSKYSFLIFEVNFDL